MASKDSEELRFPWSWQTRLREEHLGSAHYQTTARALVELVANAIDAQATKIRVQIHENSMGGVTAISVRDDGRGMNLDDLQRRFMRVGVEREPSEARATLGRLGIGRFAVYRIGGLSRWSSTSRSSDGTLERLTFTLKREGEGDLRVRRSILSRGARTGTSIRIENLRDSDPSKLTPHAFASTLVSQFCSRLLGNPQLAIIVQGERIDVSSVVDDEQSAVETIAPSSQFQHLATLRHIILRTPLNRAKFHKPLLFTALGRTVAEEDLEDAPSPNYLALVSCDYLDEVVTSNREGVIEMDVGFVHLRDRVRHQVQEFGAKYRQGIARQFIERARERSYYPFRNPSKSPLVEYKQAIYDVALNTIHAHTNVEALSQQQQALVFKLLHRAIENENLLEVLSEIVELSDDEIGRFRELLDRTTLDSILRLASLATARLEFLDVLHELVYGELKPRLRERTHLHRILENECWLFGEEFHLAASDNSFRTLIARHRARAGLDSLMGEDLQNLAGLQDIPDLYLAAKFSQSSNPKHQNLLVEIKAPRVRIGDKELSQIRRYARTIETSQEYDITTSTWDLYLVSTEISATVDSQRRNDGWPLGLLQKMPALRVWVFTWGELIERARDSMHVMREMLERKSRELTVSDYLRENYGEILSQLEQAVAATQ